MSDYPVLQQTFVCLHPMEKETMRGSCMLFTPPVFDTPEVAFDLVTIGTNLAFEPERLAAFENSYGITRLHGLPFPPPLDNIVQFDPAIWDDIWHFVVVEGAPYEIGCRYSNFDVTYNGLGRPSGT